MSEKTARPESVAAALRAIASSESVDELKKFMSNAKRLGADEVYNAAFQKFVALVPQEKPGTLEHAFWSTIRAFELLLTEERGKTTLLGRTRQKVKRVGVKETLVGFATHPTSTPGFDMLIERGLPELTGEAVVLRYRADFNDDVVSAAANRLQRVGVDITKFV